MKKVLKEGRKATKRRNDEMQSITNSLKHSNEKHSMVSKLLLLAAWV